METFVAIARSLSFTAAAHDVHLSQPAVSRQVQSLEQELGVSLLERRRRGGIELTAAGKRFLEYARDVLGRHRQLLQELREGPDGLAGEVRIAASTTTGEFLVPWFAATFTARYPEVHPEVVITNSKDVVVALRERRCDLAFAGARLPGADLVFDPIAEDEVVLAVPEDHPFAERGEIDLAELEGLPLFEREAGSGTRLTLQSALAERGLPPPAGRLVMVLGNSRAILSAVQNRHGFGFVSSLSLQDTEQQGVVGVRLAGIPMRRRLYLVTERQRSLSPPATAFVAWVRELSTGEPAATR
ncbi:MAG: LysR substrate-binding domain-containing protein [Actinomycetota bacterium]